MRWYAMTAAQHRSANGQPPARLAGIIQARHQPFNPQPDSPQTLSHPLPPVVQRLAGANLAAQAAEQVSLAAVPIVAVLLLQAGPGQIGLLSTAQSLPFLLLAIPLGLLADRVSRRRLMAAAETLRALSLAGLLLATLTGQPIGLPIGLLAVLGFVGAAGKVGFSVAAPALVPALVRREALGAANGRLALARNLACWGGVGEPTICVVAPAVLNAVHAAIGPAALTTRIWLAMGPKSARKWLELLTTMTRIASGWIPTRRSVWRSSNCFLPLTTATWMTSISRQALAPSCAVSPVIIGPVRVQAPSLSAWTLKRPRTGTSLGWPLKVGTALPSAISISISAPRPAACGRRSGGRIEHQAQRHLAGVALAGALGRQRVQQAGGVAVAPGAGVVLGVGDHHRPRCMLRPAQRLAYRRLRGQDVQAPLGWLGHPPVQQGHHRPAGRIVVAMAPHHRRAFVEIGRREAHAEAQHRGVLVAQGRQLLEALARRAEPVLWALIGIRKGRRRACSGRRRPARSRHASRSAARSPVSAMPTYG